MPVLFRNIYAMEISHNRELLIVAGNLNELYVYSLTDYENINKIYGNMDHILALHITLDD